MRPLSATSPDDASGETDPTLIEACLGGDQGAWRALVDRYSRLVYSIPRRYHLGEAAADDVFQEVFAILLAQLPRLRNRRGLPKWLITTTHRVCSQSRRREARLDDVAHREPPQSPEPPPDEVLRWERQHLVREALHRVGGRCERLLIALYLGRSDPSYEQIARELDMPVGSIGPTRARCLHKLLEEVRGLKERADDG